LSQFILADDGIEFDGRIAEEQPLGGAETATVNLLNALAARGHTVAAFTRCKERITHRGVRWIPLNEGPPATADLFIANRSWRLIRWIPRARRTVFWIHNPAGYLLKPRYFTRLLRVRPPIVFSGESHRKTYPFWAPGRRVVIPYGIDDLFRKAAPNNAVPPPRAIFTSNPLRGLDWLLKVWESLIRPVVPNAELHVFSGAAVYGGDANPKSEAMRAVIDRAKNLSSAGVVLRDPVPKAELLKEIIAARVMLYRGDEGETFCLAVGEAQAAGLPAVVLPIASLKERVMDGVTGRIATSDETFADAAVSILTDDPLWRRYHDGALEHQRNWSWDDAAFQFELLLP
jgi:glycosyltransferase involved in cell wall biosynthesis